MQAFGMLMKQGAVPGLRLEERAHLETLPFQGEVTQYPQTVTIKVEKELDTTAHQFYTLRKENSKSKWTLVKAWRHLSNGQESDLMEAQPR